ncbi:hypothetical protein D3C84_606770 [compost metagenome]
MTCFTPVDVVLQIVIPLQLVGEVYVEQGQVGAQPAVAVTATDFHRTGNLRLKVVFGRVGQLQVLQRTERSVVVGEQLGRRRQLITDA